MSGLVRMPRMSEYAPSVSLPIGTGKNFYMEGLKIGWELARRKKLHPKPCLVCGKDVHFKKSTSDRAKYCSNECRFIAQKGQPRPRKTPKKGFTFVCQVCGKDFYRAPCQIKNRATNCCSLSCRKKGGYNTQPKGENAGGWKGGITIDRKGYVRVYSPDHPFKMGRTYVMEHRLVMEKSIGRYLQKGETVHHRNGIKDDNRIENLELVAISPHIGTITCPHCSKQFSIR